MKTLITTLLISLSGVAFAQGFIAALEADDMALIGGKECTVKLVSGEEVTGKFLAGTLVNGYLSNFNIRLENGEKVKFKPEDVARLVCKGIQVGQTGHDDRVGIFHKGDDQNQLR